jgi:hypothetical protein
LVSLRSETDSISHSSVFIIFLLICISAWFTDIIGVSPIFGGFLVGIIIPHEYGFAIKLTEKIEDLVTILFLPLYFAYSGLNTRIDQLDTGKAWGFVFLVFFTACFGKILGCGLAARAMGIKWRESWAIGVLMNTKGLVEIIVLNIGYKAGAINSEVFTIMLVMALATTFMTVPVLTLIYPMKMYLTKNHIVGSLQNPNVPQENSVAEKMTFIAEPELRLMVCLPNTSNLSSMASIVQILQATPIDMTLFALRLIPLSERNSTLMMASECDDAMKNDASLKFLKTFSEVNRIGYKPMMSISHYEDYADNVLACSDDCNSNLVIVPWTPHFVSGQNINSYYDDNHRHQFLDVLSSRIECTLVIWVDRNFSIKAPTYDNELTTSSKRKLLLSSLNTSPQCVIIPFIGGANDREAVTFGQYFTHFSGLIVKILRIRVDKTKITEIIKDAYPSSNISCQTLTSYDELQDDSFLNGLEISHELQIEQVSVDDPFVYIQEYVVGKCVGSQDILLLGNDIYEHKAMRKFVDETCTLSVGLVQKKQVKETV